MTAVYKHVSLSTASLNDAPSSISVLGLVNAEEVIGTDIIAKVSAGVVNVVGGSSEAYKAYIREARNQETLGMVEQLLDDGAQQTHRVQVDRNDLGRQDETMRIVDTYCDIMTRFAGRSFDLSAWREYANTISPSLGTLVETDARGYDPVTQVIPVVEAATGNLLKLEETHASFAMATQHLPERILDVLGTGLDVDIVLYLGLCNGAGWATSVDGRKTVLLGLEKIIELDWCDAASMTSLIYHELGHLWHEACGKFHLAAGHEREKSVWHLYQEGIAMVVEQMLCADMTKYHRHDDAWLAWCEAHQEALVAEYLRRVEQGESTQDFFGDWCSYQGQSDVGYYLGCVFVKTLLQKYSLLETANLGVDVLLGELRAFSTRGCPESREGST